MIRFSVIAFMVVAGFASPSKAQDAAAGEKDFVACKSCHQIGAGAKDALGPELNGVVGRKAGSDASYSYSSASKSSGIVWTPDQLDKFLASPQAVVPHTKMTYFGLKDAQKRKDVIAYLSQFSEDGSKKN